MQIIKVKQLYFLPLAFLLVTNISGADEHLSGNGNSNIHT